MTDPPNTTARQLIRAAEIGVEEGLRFVYVGNLPGHVNGWENTRCPGCGDTLIERFGYVVRQYRLTGEGKCSKCGATIPGIWPTDTAQVTTGKSTADYYRRLPRVVM